MLTLILLALLLLLGPVQAQCEPDEYLDTTCKKCQNTIYGCNKCSLSSGFILCAECSEGLYLLKNYTSSSSYPAPYTNVYPGTMTFCVPDCRLAHSSYVNDHVTGKCQWCGEYCQSCNLKYGCEHCTPDKQTSPFTVPWANSNTLTTSLVSLITTPSGGTKNPTFNPNFKQCRQCSDIKGCVDCLDTNPSFCTTCTTTNYNLASGSCNYVQYHTGYHYDGAGDPYFQQCRTWGGDYQCDDCNDGWSIANICCYYLRNYNGGHVYLIYWGCRANGQSECIQTNDNAPYQCQMCYDYYGEIAHTDSNTYCKGCLAASNNWYFEGTKCYSSSACSTSLASCTITGIDGCRDGYTQSGQCKPSCGKGQYGTAIFNKRSYVETSTCQGCDASCYECSGQGSANCRSCNKNFYLSNIDPTNQASNLITKTTGTCKAKEVYGTFSFTLYVNSITAWNLGTNVQYIDGTYNNAFNQLQDAIKKAYEMAAPFKLATMTIVLKTGTHAMIRSNEGFYMPNRYDDWSQNVQLFIKSEDSANPVTIRYKLRDTFKFLVGAGLTIENVYFQAADSINTPHTQAQITCLADQNSDCCLSGGVLSLTNPAPSPLDMTSSKCFFPRKPTEQCYMPMGASFFYFDLSATPDRTQLTDPPTLTIKGCKFLNFLYEFNSFIELNDHGGFVNIQNTQFENMNTCGSIIRNKRYLYQKTQYGSWSTWTQAYNDRQRNYQYQMLTDFYNSAKRASNVFNCESASTPQCFSITIAGSSFSYFGKYKTTISAPTIVDSALKLQYSGSVIDLDDFKGNVQITYSTFTQNVLAYSSCDVSSLMNSNSVSAHTTLDSNKYDQFVSTSKSKLQIRSVISVVNHRGAYKIEIVKNTFSKNSGTKGIIYLDTLARTSPVIIAQNTFTQNAGFIDASVVYIRARAPSVTITPNDGSVFCAGYHFDTNTFTNNFGCPYNGGAAVRLECVDTSDSSPYVNDRIIPITLSASQQSAWYTAASYTDTPVSATYTYGALSVSVTYYMQRTTILSDTYTGNYATGGKGLIDIIGVPRVFIDSVSFINNGDSIKEVVSTYGAANGNNQINSVSGNEFTITQAYAGSFSSTMFCQGLIKIVRSRQVTLFGAQFDSNWLLEYTHNPNRAQIVTLSEFYGEFKIDKIIVKNQKGMANIPAAIGGPALVPASPAINKIASMQPLFKWQSTDLMRFIPLITTGTTSEFTNIMYHHVHTGSTVDRMFWPALSFSGSTFVTTDIQLTSVTFTNIQCYACQLSAFFIHSRNVQFNSVTMTNINSASYFDTTSCTSMFTSCKQVKPFFEFNLREQITSTNYDNVQITGMQVTNYYGGCNDGRLFDFAGVAGGSSATPMVQVTFTNSRFNQIYFDCEGAFAKISLRTMQFKIDGVGGVAPQKTFQSIYARYPSNVGFGGVLYIDSLNKLFLNNVEAEDFKVSQNTPTNGGGRFLYYKQDNQELLLDIRSSKFRCSPTSTVFDASLQTTTRLPGSQYDQGSVIHAESTLMNIQIDMLDTTIEHCYNSLNGAAVFFVSPMSKSLRLTRNIFNYNVALNGGAIFCEKCNWDTMLQNSFYSNYAQLGGDIYFKDSKVYPITLQSHVHDSSVALTSGAGIFLHDVRNAAAIGGTINYPQLIINKAALGTSEYKNTNCNPSGCNGGAIAVRSLEKVDIQISSTSFMNNRAGANGAVIFVEGSINNKALTVSLTSSTFTNNAAVTSASILYAPSTASTSSLTIADTDFTTNQATNGDGGLFYMSAVTSNSIIFNNALVPGAGINSIINTASSGGNGGVFYFNGQTNTLTLDEKTQIQYATASQHGGMAYIQGTLSGQNNIINQNGASIRNSVATLGSGGIAYMTGTAIHKFNSVITNGVAPIISTITASSHGGALYMNGAQHYIVLSGLNADTITSSGEGGFLYSTTVTTLLNVQISNTKMLAVKALTQGSIISLRKGATDPSLTLSINTNSEFQCLTQDLEPNVLTIQSTLTGSTQTIGGAFYFESVSTGSTVTSQSSSYYNCYTAQSGAIYYLPPNLVFTDTGSTFKQNAAFKGTIYCQGCTATFTGSTFRDNIAQDGSVINMLNDAAVSFSNPNLSFGRARRYGGAIYAGGTGTFFSGSTQLRPKITISSCTSTIQGFDAVSKGGFMYIDHPQMIIDLSGCSYQHLYSADSGGFIEGAQYQSFIMSSCTTMKNISAANSGSFIKTTHPNSIFELTSCNFQCNMNGVAPSLSTVAGSTFQGSLIDITNAQRVKSITNSFQYCYLAQKGSIFKVTQSTQFTDTSSLFAHNAAHQGGAIYLDTTSATFTSTQFENNYGQYGGTLYLTGQQTLQLLNCKGIGSSASLQGGFIYATEPTGFQTVAIQVYTTSSIPSNVDYSNINAGGEGGMFYLGNDRVSLDIQYTGSVATDRIKFNTISSSSNGGLIYSNSLLGIIIKKAQMSAISAATSGGVMYNQRVSSITIEDTTFTSCQAISGGGGLAYIENTATNLGAVQLTRVTAQLVKSRLSGSMIYSDSPSAVATFTISNGLYECLSSAFTSITLTSSDQGGAFYIRNAQQVTSLSNTIRYCYLSPSGGAFHIENSKFTDTLSDIRDNAAIQGGAITCKTCSQLTLTQTQLNHHESSTTSGKGGVLYLENTQVTLLDRVTIVQGESKDKGGLAYIVGTVNPASFTIDNLANGVPLQIEQFKAATHGGGFYVDHPLLSISMTKPVAVKDSKALGGSGGFMYFNQVGKVDLGALSSSQSTFQDISATVSGSLLYSVASGLQLSVINSKVDCTLLGQQSISTVLDLSSTLGISVPSQTKGGAFYIKDATTATQVNTLTLYNCYTGDKGGAFSVINTVFKDQTSRYYHNGAIKGGAVYCDDCWMELNDVKYYWSQAQDGGTFYITTLKSTGSTILMQNNVQIYNSKAFRDGGSFFVFGTVSSRQLDVSSMNIDQTLALNNGGMLYVDNSLQSILATDLTVTNSASQKSGGVFYVKNSAAFTINELTASKSLYHTFIAPDYGSFFYSESTTIVLSISDTDLECTTVQLMSTFSDYSSWSTLTPTSTRAGAFHIQNAVAQVTSFNNQFQRCYAAKKGGIFTLVNSKLQETSSLYNQNAAILGGVFYLDDSKLDITSATISNSYAAQGGILYKIGKQNIDIKSSILTSNQVKLQGGIGYFIDKGGFNQATDLYTITLNSPLTQLTTITTTQADLDGGSFYFDSKQISAVNIDKLKIVNSKTLMKNGGVFFVNKIAGLITITSSTFDTYTALLQGSFLYSGSDTQFGLVTTSSAYDCKTTQYDPTLETSKVLTKSQGTFGGAFYIKDSIPGVISSLSFFRNCYTSFEGGAFHLVNTKLADIKSKFMQNAANYGGAFKCDDCIITLTDSEVRDNDAYDGGAVYSLNKITFTATRTVFYNNKAKNNGGVLAITNSAYTTLTATAITFQSCPTINRNKADYGAFAYYDNDFASLNIFDSQIQNHTAYKRSAFIEALNMGIFKIRNTFASDFFAPETTLMHSVAKKLNMNLSESTIVCDSFYKDWNAPNYINTTTIPQSTHNTKFYIQQATNVSLYNNKVRMCGTSLYGGVFWLTQGTKFNDISSTFEYNSAANGGVINCQSCQMDLQKTFFQYNQAWRGAAIEIKENGYMKNWKVKYDRNVAYFSAGAVYLNTFSNMDLYETEFTNNQAPENSAIEVLQSSRSKNLTIEDCLFEKNVAIKNTISMRDANAAINKTIIQRNQASYLSKHLFIGFSNVYIEDTQFKGVSVSNPKLQSQSEETLGSHLYAILSSKVWIKDSYFLDGLSKLGGAMYIEGNSSIDMIRTIFQNNYARRKGGAIFANGFNLLRTSGQSKFLNNLANEDGDDIYISNTEGYFVLDSTQIENPRAVTSIAAENVNVTLSNVFMKNIGVQPHRALTEGSGLSCYNCRAILIDKSQFTNLNSQRGGALYIQESDDNKLLTDRYGKYRIQQSNFESCSANAGGAIFLNNPQYMTINQNSVFRYNKAKNSSNEALKSIRGSGGGLYYQCDDNSLDCIVDITRVTFANNYAEIKGGGIHWNTLEPLWGGLNGNGNLSSITFSKNKAGRYGDSISAFATQIAIIDEKDFKSTMFATTSFNQGSKRLLQDDSIESNITEVTKNVTFKTQTQLNDQRSGGSIPKMYIGLLDKYGQIVASDDESKVSIMIDAISSNQADQNLFPPFIEGSTQYEVQNGVVQVKDIAFAASPGYNYSLRFSSPNIKTDISNNNADSSATSSNSKGQIQKLNLTQLMNMTEVDKSIVVDIQLRECEAGEQFQWNGKCSQCPTNTSFNLIKMDQPGDCQSCPTDKAVCYGGTNVGPSAGHWRKSNKSANFLTCLYKPACLGMIPPMNDPKGSCADGYQGIMCADCKEGYTRSREYQCSKCPPLGWVIGRMVLIPFVILIVVSILISSQSKTRYLHVYLRQLINHIQLILLIAAFNFNWPDILQQFFDFSRPISQPFSEFLELDCLTLNYMSTAKNNTVAIRYVYIQSIFLAGLPILFMIIAKVSTKIQLGCKNRKLQKVYTQETENRTVEEDKVNSFGKTMRTFTILMAIAYPNIMQFMLSLFKCIDVDGDTRLKIDLEIVCWSTNHQIFAYVVAAPSIIVWGVGLPILAFALLTNNRADIISAKSPNVQETYGFIYGGFKADFYFWEIIITMRKLILIAVCIFVTNFGVLTQALITLLVLVLFLVLTARKRPFISEPLFDLEALSLATGMITVYCGLFYLADTSQMGTSNFDKSSDVTFMLGKDSKTFLLSGIVSVNSVFFLYWLFRVISEMEALRGFILKTFPKLYLICFACGDKDQAYLDKQKNRVLNDNEGHKEELMRILRNVKDLYNRGDLLLNDEVMRRLRQHINPEKVLQVAGVVDQNDSELTKMIQQQLKTQYDIQVQNAQLSGIVQNMNDTQETSKYLHHRSVIGSLLSDPNGNEKQDAQLRYLQVLQALKQTQVGNNPQDEDSESYHEGDTDLHNQMHFEETYPQGEIGDLLQSQNLEESDQFNQARNAQEELKDGWKHKRNLNSEVPLIDEFERNYSNTQQPIQNLYPSLIQNPRFEEYKGTIPRKMTSLDDLNNQIVEDEVNSQNMQAYLENTKQMLLDTNTKQFPKVVGKLMISTGNSFSAQGGQDAQKKQSQGVRGANLLSD